MTLTAVCPKDSSHKRFSTVASVMEDWEVDEHGNFVRVIESLQTNHGPDPGNDWWCMDCNTQAKVTNS